MSNVKRRKLDEPAVIESASVDGAQPIDLKRPSHRRDSLGQALEKLKARVAGRRPSNGGRSSTELFFANKGGRLSISLRSESSQMEPAILDKLLLGQTAPPPDGPFVERRKSSILFFMDEEEDNLSPGVPIMLTKEELEDLHQTLEGLDPFYGFDSSTQEVFEALGFSPAQSQQQPVTFAGEIIPPMSMDPFAQPAQVPLQLPGVPAAPAMIDPALVNQRCAVEASEQGVCNIGAPPQQPPLMAASNLSPQPPPQVPTTPATEAFLSSLPSQSQPLLKQVLAHAHQNEERMRFYEEEERRKARRKRGRRTSTRRKRPRDEDAIKRRRKEEESLTAKPMEGLNFHEMASLLPPPAAISVGAPAAADAPGTATTAESCLSLGSGLKFQTRIH